MIILLLARFHVRLLLQRGKCWKRRELQVLQVVPGQPGGGSFKIETLMLRAYRTEPWSHRSFSWKLIIASHCHRGLCHLISCHIVSSQRFFNLISSHLISCLLSFSQLFSADHNSSQLIWALLFPDLLSFSILRSSFQLSSSPLF